MTIHEEPSPLAGKEVTVQFVTNKDNFTDAPEGKIKILVEDWWDRVYGQSWMLANNNFAATNYAIRLVHTPVFEDLDDEVLYGMDTATGLKHLFHISEVVES